MMPEPPALHGLSPAVNCSTLFRDRPFLRRLESARRAGFSLVEFWWPFATGTPSQAEVGALVDAVTDAGVGVACMNLFAGDLGAGDRGILNDPARQQEFRAAVRSAASLSGATGCRRFNALYGLEPSPPRPDWRNCAKSNLLFACETLGAVGADVLLEPLCRNTAYGLHDPHSALAAVAELHGTGLDNVGLLADLYQLAAADVTVPAFLAANLARIRHVQIADDPGRGAPGTGKLPIADWLATLVASGYTGAVGLEYLEIEGVDSFAWLHG